MSGPSGRLGTCLKSVDVAVLAGGKGTRIRGVLGDTPKILAPIAGRPFLDYLLDWLSSYGACRFVFCLGHLADPVLEHLRRCPTDGMSISTVVEPEPLGTLGALRHARSRLISNPVLVLNGDTFTDANVCDFVAHHSHANADLSMLCVQVPDAARYGSVEIDRGGHVVRFREKSESPSGGWINAGVYLFSTELLQRLDSFPGQSLERDFLTVLPAGKIRAETTTASFIDIGTPDSLVRAAGVLPAARSHSR